MKASSLTRRGEEDETGLPRYILSTSKWCKGIWGGLCGRRQSRNNVMV